MRLETFRGRTVAAVDALARETFGEEACILRTTAIPGGGRAGIEVMAAPATELSRLLRLVDPRQVVAQPIRRGPAPRPRVVALVGPTGAGKTTTIAKLATNPAAYGTLRVGLLTLDTHRAGGFEQLQAYADAAGLPCAIAYDAAEAHAAMRQFADRDVVLIDTAGRGPTKQVQARSAAGLLAQLRPDEVHLAIPATLRMDLVARLRDDYKQCTPGFALLTKLDEVPADTALAEMASALGLRMRWATDGQDVPTHLRIAGPAILAPLGLSVGTAA